MTETLDRAGLRRELIRQRLGGTAKPRQDDVIAPVPRDGALPLSPGQRRLWILDQIQPGSTEYVVTTGARLRGRLDPAALRAALDGVVARHEVLRTRYPMLDGEPVQVVDEPSPVDLTELDLRRSDRASADRRIAELAAGERAPIDLAAGPVLRATLVRTGEEEHTLLVTVHHIAFDEWSKNIMWRDIQALYAAATQGRAADLAPLPVQYVDVAAWQQARLADPAQDRHLAYWRERLTGSEPLELPTDRPRPAVRDAAGDELPFRIPAETAQPLMRLARAHGATPFMALLATFAILLGRYARRRDVVVGSPVAGRDRPEVQDLVGMLLNTLVLRVDLTGSPSFVDVLQRVRDVVLDAHAHQELPFERVVDDLVPDRDPSRNPLFSTMLLWQGTCLVPRRAELAGLTFDPLPLAESSAKVDLTLSVADRGDGSLAGALNYATALFDRSTAARMAGHYTHVLAQVAARPDTPIAALDPVTEAERELVTRGWNATAADYPDTTLDRLVDAQVRRTPDAVAVHAGGAAVTYRELDARAGRLAARLRALGAGPESVVGVSVPRGIDLVVALLGVLQAGAAYLPLEPDHPARRRRQILETAGAGILVTASAPADPLAPTGDVAVVLVDELTGDMEDGGPVALPQHPAYVMATSGSTGEPKLVVVEHRAIVNRLLWMQEAYRLTPTDRVLHKAPYGFDVSVWELFWPLITGATVVLAAPGGQRDPGYLGALMAEEGVTVAHFVPSMLRAFLAEPELSLPALRLCVCSGEPLTADLVTQAHQRLGLAVRNLYGPTEAAVDVTADTCQPGAPVTIGRPIANTRTHIVDEALRPVPVGVPGELVLGGAQLARGYLGRPAATADRFVPDPFGPVVGAEPGGRLYRTGDLARYRADGRIEYLGRLDDQLKVRGHRIEPAEVEAVLAGHPGVRAAAVAVRDERLVGYLLPDSVAGSAPEMDPDAVRAHAAGRLPAQMVPTRWMVLDELPLTPSGKLARAALPAPGPDDPMLGTDRTAPRDPTEQAVADAMAAALGVPRVGAHDRFFQLGGDSMRAIRLVGALRAGGVEVSVQDVLTHQSVAELAALVASSGADRPSTMADVPPVEPFALLDPADRERLGNAAARGVVDAYPLAETQAGMVYETLSGDGRPVYRNVSCYRVRDPETFSWDALQQAARLVVDRHEILRTSFALSGYTVPLQLVHATATPSTTYTDLRGTPEPDRDATVRAFLLEQRTAGLEVDVPPLLRWHVHQMTDREWFLTHTESHAILDGWSHTSVVAELIETYRALRRGAQPTRTAPPPVRFADVIAAERRALADGTERAFWRELLSGWDKLELPDGWADPDALGVDAADAVHQVVEIRWDDLEPGLRALAAAAGASLKSVLHAAHLKAIGVATGRRRFFDGLVGNVRMERLGGDEVAGMHLNTVPFPADVTAPTWRELVRSVFDAETRMWPHRRYPMPAIRRDRGDGAALIDVMFGYLDFHVMDWASDTVALVDDFSPNELALQAWTFPGMLGLAGPADRISRSRLEMLARTYRHVLEAMAADPDGDTRGVGLAPEDERRATVEVNRTDRAILDDLLAHHLVEQQALSRPDAVALRCGDTTASYRELDRTANRIAHLLGEIGVGPDTVVGLHLARGPELVTALLAVLKAGGAFLPLDPELPPDRLASMVADAGVGVVLTATMLSFTVPSDTIVEALNPCSYGGFPAEPPDVPVHPDNLAYVIYTSGSTGRPKGVGVPHGAAVNLRHACFDDLDVRPGDRVLQFASPNYDASVWETLMALTAGAELVLPPPGTDPTDLRQQAGLVTHLVLPPSVLATLSPADFPRLRVLVAGGEACPAEEVARWAGSARFVNAYGPTETAVCATLTDVPASATERAPSIGRPIANVRAYVVDEDGRPLTDGVRGELLVGGAGVARGYLGRPDLTADRFRPDPFGGRPGARLYRTGDLVSRNPDGTLQFHGRVDHQVKVRGFRIELGEIEQALRTHPGVAAAVVTTHRAGTDDATLVAYLRVPAGAVSAPPPAELREYLLRQLPRHMVPTRYLAVQSFPTTPSGKVDRAALPEPDGGRPDLTGGYVAPRTELERVLAAAWQEALHLDRVGIHDDFFDLGGHSMAMMRVIATLRADHGIELTFRSFLEQHTVAAVAAEVEAARGGAGTGPAGRAPKAMLWLRQGGSRLPLFCLHPGGGSAHWFQRFLPYLDPEVPVAAFEWPRPHGDSDRIPTVQELAGRHYVELREAQPHGPYRLFSWCGGSAIASEIAHRLVSEGEEVTFMLLDPALDAHTRPNVWEQLRLLRRLERLVSEVAEGGPEADTPERRSEIVRMLRRVVTDTPDREITLPEHGVGDAWPRTVRVYRETIQAILEYPHRPYPGRLHLIVSDDLVNSRHAVIMGQTFDDYVARWRELVAGGVEVHRIPGAHIAVMHPPLVANLTGVIAELIDGG